jgi:Ca-activated chloride channel family protein
MIGWRLSAAVVIVGATIAATAAAQDRPDPPVFRSRATAVSLDVSVRRGNRPATGLTAADFAVTDNGVAQTVEQVFANVVPIDATLVIDASGSTSAIFEDIRRNTQQILGLLRPTDRARVLVIKTGPYELLSLRPVGRGLMLPAERVPGVGSAIYDAIAAGLVTRTDPDRRRLLVVITDGADTDSVTSVETLEQIARRMDTVLHIILVSSQLGPDPALPTRRPVVTFALDGPLELLARLPAVTGGALHPPRYDPITGAINAVRSIREVLDEFRQSYVIQYTPRNVTTGSWHAVVVRVKDIDPRNVRSRAGYFDAVR